MTYNSIDALTRAGIKYDDAVKLRRISMTLDRWHELECGNGNDYASWCIVRGHAPKREFYRDPETQAPKWRTVGEFTYDDDGVPYIERHFHTENSPRYERIPDRESGALKRLNKIMADYNGFRAYVQGDPRGCALYIMRPDDLRGLETDEDISCNYTRGIPVCR